MPDAQPRPAENEHVASVWALPSGLDGISYPRYVPPASQARPRDQVRATTHNSDKEPGSPPKRKLDSATAEAQQHDPKKSKSPSKTGTKSSLEPEDISAGLSASKSKERKTKIRKRNDQHEPVEGHDRKTADEHAEEQPPGDEVHGSNRREKGEKKTAANRMLDQDDAREEPNDVRHKAVLDRKSKALKLAGEARRGLELDEISLEAMELHGLEPLPQPEQATLDTSKPSYETLPLWLAVPTKVAQETRTSFAQLGIEPRTARVLEGKGYCEAFAVQTAAIPLLLPSSRNEVCDLLISAATGSGKTLAYALPIVRDISQGAITRLRALVVLPTRELVRQARETFELCAKACEARDRKRARIGIAVGSQTLKSEQEALIEQESRYDPARYHELLEEEDTLLSVLDPNSNRRLGIWEGQVIEFSSKVDVLICTPGRLVEHLEQTPGFSLDDVRWLVVDEADKLLAQSFQGWLDTVMARFQTNKFSARDFPDMNLNGIRKVILSATLTRDLSLLNQLDLRRPRLIVLEREGDVDMAEHSLPRTLREYAVRVHDTNLKPLYLLALLTSSQMKGSELQETKHDVKSPPTTRSESDSESDSSSDTSSDTETSTSASSSPPTASKETSVPVALIFTKSNESALRLSRLLAILDGSLSKHIGTLTSTAPSHVRRKTLRAFTTPQSPVRLIIASDLVARGIDLPRLDHVINYDLPPGVPGYVHRVGRTARAGRPGSAWTLVGDDESGWFWGKIAKGTGIRREQRVDRVIIAERSEREIEEYERALGELGKEATEPRRKLKDRKAF